MATKKKRKIVNKKKVKKPSKRELRKRALRGWETRRARYGVSGNVKKDTEKRKRKVLAEQVKQLELEKADLALQIENLKRFSEFVEDSDWIRQNGTIAKNPSSLRHLGEASQTIRQEMLAKFWENGVEDGVEIIDKTEFYEQAQFYAEYFDVEVREVYTLFFSP